MNRKATQATSGHTSTQRRIGVLFWIIGATLLTLVVMTIVGITTSTNSATMTPAQIQESRATIESESSQLDSEGAHINQLLNVSDFDVNSETLE